VTPADQPVVVSVQVGRVAPLGPDEVPSAFIKTPVDKGVIVRRLGLEGDVQADLSVHGGVDKAVYLYPARHYQTWRHELPQHADVLLPGGFGENLTVSALDEESVCLGDVVRIGSATLQVTQFRQPCFKLGLRFGDNRMPRAMLKTGRSGWYARVLGEGALGKGDAVVLQDRPNPTWPVRRLAHLFAHRDATLQDMAELSCLEGLAAHWRRIAKAFLRNDV